MLDATDDARVGQAPVHRIERPPAREEPIAIGAARHQRPQEIESLFFDKPADEQQRRPRA